MTPAPPSNIASDDPLWLKIVLTATAATFLVLMLLLPLGEVFTVALSRGLQFAVRSLGDPDTLAAVRLTLVTALVVVPINTALGLAASWALGKHAPRGRSFLLSLLDLPLSVSPVVAGLSFVLVFGAQGWFGRWLEGHGVRIVFAPPGIVLATLFVTFPFVAREVIPTMQDQGPEEEEAAVTLGAGGLAAFFRITVPNIRWALLYGVVLCASRAMGEFGAVSVVSGRIRGATDTLPLQIEALYDDYDLVAAFAAASLLCAFALGALGLKAALQRLRTEDF